LRLAELPIVYSFLFLDGTIDYNHIHILHKAGGDEFSPTDSRAMDDVTVTCDITTTFG
jgi:hypothetical protein